MDHRHPSLPVWRLEHLQPEMQPHIEAVREALHQAKQSPDAMPQLEEALQAAQAAYLTHCDGLQEYGNHLLERFSALPSPPPAQALLGILQNASVLNKEFPAVSISATCWERNVS